MRSKVLIGFLSLLGLAFVVPANAVTVQTTLVPGGADYALFGKQAIKMEDGAFTQINGNVAVNDPGGLLRIGQFNVINGTATADNMFFGTGAHVTTCEFNTSTGGNPGPRSAANPDAVCDNVVSPLPAGTFPLTAWPAGIPLPIPVVPVTNNNIVCDPPSLNLAQGDYGTLNVKDGCVLNLTTANGTYNFKSVRLQNQSVTNGNGADVNVKGQIITEAGVKINNVTMTSIASGTFEAIQIGNNSTLLDVILYAPFARMHLHQGDVFTNFEGVAVFITVEPIQIFDSPGPVCACIGAIAKGNGTIDLSSGCHLNSNGLEFFVSTTCAIDTTVACPGAGCFAATRQNVPAPTDSTATLTAPAVPAGSYHVIVRSTSGAFCTAATVALP